MIQIYRYGIVKNINEFGDLNMESSKKVDFQFNKLIL